MPISTDALERAVRRAWDSPVARSVLPLPVNVGLEFAAAVVQHLVDDPDVPLVLVEPDAPQIPGPDDVPDQDLVDAWIWAGKAGSDATSSWAADLARARRFLGALRLVRPQVD
jgi:hypothetical protein